MKLLQGIVVPTVTPLTPQGTIDETALRTLLGQLVAGGVNGIFAVGTTGEGPALSREIRRRAVEITCDAVAGRVPIVVAAIETSVDDLLATAEHAAVSGAQAIAIAPPFYLPLGQQDIIRFGLLVADEARLPSYLYNVPFGNLPQFSLAALEKLGDHERILGLKDSSGDFAQLESAVAIFQSRPECSVLVGPERLLLRALRAGADGGVSGGANLLPRLYVGLYQAFLKGDAEACETLQDRILTVERHFYSTGAPESGLVRGLKTALEVRGIGTAVLAPPFEPPTAGEYDRVRGVLAEWNHVTDDASAVIV